LRGCERRVGREAEKGKRGSGRVEEGLKVKRRQIDREKDEARER
jgi:hypothetical protein